MVVYVDPLGSWALEALLGDEGETFVVYSRSQKVGTSLSSCPVSIVVPFFGLAKYIIRIL